MSFYDKKFLCYFCNEKLIVGELNIYCDESCHLLKDKSDVMVLGAIICPKKKRQEIFTRIREIKEKHKLGRKFEVKWNKVSNSKVNFYLELIDYFYDDDDLKFRGLVVPSKSQLDHERYNQTHEDFYYKMYFDLLKVIMSPSHSYYIYLDIKDTNMQEKIVKLLKYLRTTHYDFKEKIIRRIQQVRSDEVEVLQLTDLLIGAIGYLHRGLDGNAAKVKLIKRIQQRSGYELLKSTLYLESKTNLFVWEANK